MQLESANANSATILAKCTELTQAVEALNTQRQADAEELRAARTELSTQAERIQSLQTELDAHLAAQEELGSGDLAERVRTLNAELDKVQR